ncbi:MAG: hypothetical protein HYS12_13090 [Planctomycetes bacterium]|nr:hypothetical protein [Planctomycetota bacterium]
MLFRLLAPVTNFVKKRRRPLTPEKGVPELLAALTEIRTRKAQLDQEEKEIIAATRARLRDQQEALEDLRRKVHDSGIEVPEHAVTPSASIPIAAEDDALRPSQQVLLNN